MRDNFCDEAADYYQKRLNGPEINAMESEQESQNEQVPIILKLLKKLIKK